MARFKKAVNATKIIGIVFTVFGILFAAIGIGVNVEFANFKETAEHTTAEITHIETYTTRGRKGRTKTNHDVFVKYSVDGVTYNTELDYYNSGMYVGGEVEVYYDPEKPHQARGDGSPVGWIFAGIGSVFAVIGICVGIIPTIKHGNKKRLMITGVQATGIITGTRADRSVRINGRYPYKAECEVVDEYTGERFLYSSDGVMGDISCLVGQQVAVYYDPNDRSKYYIDLDSVEMQYPDASDRVHDYR